MSMLSSIEPVITRFGSWAYKTAPRSHLDSMTIRRNLECSSRRIESSSWTGCVTKFNRDGPRLGFVSRMNHRPCLKQQVLVRWVVRDSVLECAGPPALSSSSRPPKSSRGLEHSRTASALECDEAITAYNPPAKSVLSSSSASPSAHTSVRLAMAAGMCCSKWGLPRLRLRWVALGNYLVQTASTML